MTETTLQPARQLSRAEFLQNVRDARPRTAVFDFDGTLWPGDAGSGFLHWTIATRLLPAEATRHILDRHAMYNRGEVDEISICGEMIQIYEGIEEKRLRAAAERYFADHVKPHFFPEMIGLLRDLQADGAEIWAVSSTNNWMIEEGVRELGIPADRVLAASVAVEDGAATAKLLDVPSDEGKAEALRRVGLGQPDAVFGNSVHDLHMLEMARHAYPVNPTAALADAAAKHGWPVYYPATDKQ